MKTFLQETLHDQIPITKAMGITVMKAEDDEVVLKAPLALNINHKLTAFGGSLNTLAVLACWSLIFVRLHHRNIHGHIVIQSSATNYLTPVTEDLQAVCHLKNEKDFDKMIKMFERHGKGRIKLEAEMSSGASLALQFEGEYVIHR